MENQSKKAVTPINVQPSAPSKKKRRGKKNKSKGKPGVAPQRRQETKFETALASALNHVRGDKPPAVVPYSEMNKAQKYALGMVDPIHYPTRAPDADSNQTALFRSYEVFEIPVRTGPDITDSGAFAIAIQPKVGNTDSVNHFKVAIADPNLISDNPQATDWSSPNSYMSRIGSLDPRMVNEVDTLALNESGFFNLSSGGTLSAAQPLGTDPVENAGNGFINVDYNIANGDLILPVGQFQVTGQILASGGNVSSISLSAGSGGAPSISLLTTPSGVGTANAQQSWIVSTTPQATHIRLASTLSAGTISAASVTIVPTAKTLSLIHI